MLHREPETEPERERESQREREREREPAREPESQRASESAGSLLTKPLLGSQGSCASALYPGLVGSGHILFIQSDPQNFL